MRFITTKWAYLLGFGMFAMPAFAYADGGSLSNLITLLDSVVTIVNILIPLVMALAVLAFFWGLVQALWGGGDEAKTKGKTLMIWGVIILFVMVAIWGIIQFIASNLGISTGGTVVPPNVQTVH